MTLYQPSKTSGTRPSRASQSSFDRPSALKTLPESVFVCSHFCGPVLQALSFAAECYQMVTSHIAHLLSPSGPAAVLFRVPQGIVYAFNRMFRRRSWSYVAVERLKQMPFITNCDSASTVSRIPSCRGALTAASHPKPNLIFRQLAQAVGGISTRNTACTGATSQIRAKHDRLISAIADAVPVSSSAWGFCFVNDCPLAKSLASQVYETGAAECRIGLVHQKNLLYRFGRWKGPGGSNDLPLGPFYSTARRDGGQVHAA